MTSKIKKPLRTAACLRFSPSNYHCDDPEEAKDDMFVIFAAAPHEVAGFRRVLRAGEIDGGSYYGSCSCLVGTLSRLQTNDPNAASAGDWLRIVDTSAPAERFFRQIEPGDNPDNSEACALVDEWVEEWFLSNPQWEK